MARIIVPYDMDQQVLDYIRQYAEVDCFHDRLTQAEAEEIIGQYDGILQRGTKVKVNEALVEKAVNLKAIGMCRAGLDDVAVDLAKERGIKVFNSGDCSKNAVAEITIMHILNASRRFSHNMALAKDGRWTSRTQVGSFETADQTLGIVGFGKIGRKVAGIAKALDMRVIAYDAFLGEGQIDGVELMSLDALLAQSDYVSLHCPLTPSTAGLIGARELAKMKQGAYIFNIARGRVLDEDALYDALVSGHLGGAGLDALTSEPMEKGYRLSLLDNVYITPHVGDCAENTQRKIAKYVADQVLDAIGCR